MKKTRYPSNKNRYWRDAEIKQRQWLLNAHIDETEKEILKQYQKTSEKIVDKMTILYDKIQNSDSTAKISDLYSYERYYQSLISVKKELDKYGIKQTKILSQGLCDLYNDVEILLNEEYRWVGVSNKDAVREAIYQTWVNDGKNFEDRITIECKQLAQRLEETLVDGIQQGTSTEKLAHKLSLDCNISLNQSRRLVRTEMAHCEVKGTIDKYEKAGVKQFRWLTASGCCDECAEKNGQVYDLSADIPPAHPNCRCSVLAVIDIE